jgi:hypothetical protein
MPTVSRAQVAVVGWVLFLSSFAPLLVVFGLLDSFGSAEASDVCYALAGLSAVVLFAGLETWRRLGTTEVVVCRVRPRDTDVIAYVATYIVPFAALGANNWHERAALIGFFLLVGVLYVRAELFYVNPLLAVAGFKLFELETDSGRVLLALTKRRYISTGQPLHLHTLTDFVFLEAA